MAIEGVLIWRAVQSKLSMMVGLVQQTSTLGEKHQKVLQALLRRVCMHGHVPWNTLTPFFDAIQNQDSNPKALRVLYYLNALVLSSGSAGAPQHPSSFLPACLKHVCCAAATACCSLYYYSIWESTS